jgi:hypothetical protein
MVEGDINIEDEAGRESLLDDDEISPAEEGFMEGASGDGQGAKCRKCGKILTGDDFVERRSKPNDEIFRFCSDECSDKYFENKE